jgi:inosine-uridine nucleoside N-ribohydrolase
MSKKIIIIADPGIDTAFALALAFHDPDLDVIGLIASAGNVDAEQATQNIQLLVNQLEPPKWPRVGAALPIKTEMNGTSLHGPDGLGGQAVPITNLHPNPPGDRLLIDLVKENPKEVTLIVLGPATILASAIDREPSLPEMLDQIFLVGGAWHEPGNATAAAEFHVYCDPESFRQVLHSGGTLTILPLDLMRKLVFSPTDLLELPRPNMPPSDFLRKIVPYGIRASSNMYGIEGFHLKDVIGIVALALPGAIRYRSAFVDVELKGEITRGMTIMDVRINAAGSPNARVGTEVDVVGVRDYISKILRSAGCE